MTCCPVPGCTIEAPKNNIFCPDHYFQIPPLYTRSVNRIQVAYDRAEDVEQRDYLRRQLNGYISVAISKIQGGKNAA